ncbi:MAG TPA: hypothetical protein H9902_12610 [Candidatus Stackebrandtia faecavium]|nr:hypothetical protein [Candidatus Stackebrandtia faecavium]
MTESTIADRAWLIETLENLVDDDIADLDPQADLSDYGLDSIRVFELVQKLRAVRPDIQFADIAENLTIDGLCEIVEDEV